MPTPNPDEPCDRAIRAAVLAGDAAAWRVWYDRHYARLHAYIRWRCGHLPDLADEVTQDTWLTAVRQVRTFDPGRGPAFAWLCGIAANAARTAVRGRKAVRPPGGPPGGRRPARPGRPRQTRAASG